MACTAPTPHHPCARPHHTHATRHHTHAARTPHERHTPRLATPASRAIKIAPRPPERAGSCAAALLALGGGRLIISAVEIDEAVVEIARDAHGLPISSVTSLAAPAAPPVRVEREIESLQGVTGRYRAERENQSAPKRRRRGGGGDADGGGGSGDGGMDGDVGDAGAGGISVVVADASSYLAHAGSRGAWLDCVLLDAYDANGDVPAHLQADGFLARLAAALLPDGLVLANLWQGSPAARASCEAFARRLEEAVGCVFALRVVGQESNIVLLARKPAAHGGAAGGGLPGAERVLETTRARLRRGMGAVPRAAEEAGLLGCMQSNVDTLELFF